MWLNRAPSTAVVVVIMLFVVMSKKGREDMHLSTSELPSIVQERAKVRKSEAHGR